MLYRLKYYLDSMGQQAQCCNANNEAQKSQMNINISVFNKVKQKFHLKQDTPEYAISRLAVISDNQFRQSKVRSLKQQSPHINTQLYLCSEPPQLNYAVKNRLKNIGQSVQVSLQRKQQTKSQTSNNIQQQKAISENQYFCFKRTGIVYQGQWQKGKPHGQGHNFYPNGSLYIGSFEEGIPHGRGKFILSKGDYYQGQIKFGRANGEGTYQSQQQVYRGMFKDNMKHGPGQQIGRAYYFKGIFEYNQKKEGYLKYSVSNSSELRFRNKSNMSYSGVRQQKAQNLYDGTFQNQKFHGSGRLSTSEGYYIGAFKQGFQHGYGQFRWADGSTYKGQYRNGVRQGEGQYFNAVNNSISKGMWRSGILEGKGQYIEAKGAINKCIWSEGKIVQLLR